MTKQEFYDELARIDVEYQERKFVIKDMAGKIQNHIDIENAKIRESKTMLASFYRTLMSYNNQMRNLETDRKKRTIDSHESLP